MIDKLRACLYILLSDRYAVFATIKTETKDTEEAFFAIRNATNYLLTNAVSFIRETMEEYKQDSETILNEIDNEQTND